jgi:hypothetical protein
MQQYLDEDNERMEHINFLISVLELRLRVLVDESPPATQCIGMQPQTGERYKNSGTTVAGSGRALQSGLLRIRNGSVETMSQPYVSRQSSAVRKRSAWYLSSPHPLSWTHVKRIKYY